MSASVNDKITDVRNSARPVSTTVSSGRSSGATTLACASLTGWPTASKVHFVTYQVDSNSNPVAGTQLDCYGIVSGSNVNSLVVIDGTDNGNSIGDIVEMLPTSAWGQDLADALTNQHSRTGTHTAITATSISTTGNASVGGTLGVTGVATFTAVPLLPANTVETADIQNAAVTADKLGTGAATATVATSETTTSTSYTQLSTTTDQVTVTIGANGLALVSLYCHMNNNTANVATYMAVDISGATTVAATDTKAIRYNIPTGGGAGAASAVFLLTGLTAGSNTFKAMYRVPSNTGTFLNRTITVVPL